ncbi:hypothetical protein [Amycolatopsis viridis]|uniref:Uncharacterized protein n=1 Tax=Amycolatopsis viridis TaxID=185678 RepID=A0ABX0SN74_9PSEU|nr:hypothetical protein [Amycolatopsis viridis]NIH78060.1 hypothetical protein [Amycolatopsis viridis]
MWTIHIGAFFVPRAGESSSSGEFDQPGGDPATERDLHAANFDQPGDAVLVRVHRMRLPRRKIELGT